jgi:hypothetical protein
MVPPSGNNLFESTVVLTQGVIYGSIIIHKWCDVIYGPKIAEIVSQFLLLPQLPTKVANFKSGQK